jgi:asparagine synthase (glutamine-hydrolysing)
MCGITGIFHNQGADIELLRSQINASLDVISHRGPDGRDVHIDKKMALGHVRLSIIDLSSAGSQPMISKDQQSIITYNGEVYNFNELKEELLKNNVIFNSTTDTEVVLEYFQLHGVASFQKLNGMFAFALIDQANSLAYLVRDRFGVKPLFYQVDDKKITFASEIKAIKAINYDMHTNVMDENTLPEWSYFGNSLGRNTIHKNIKQLLPGHYIEIDLNNLAYSEKPYWRPESLEYKEKKSNYKIPNIIKKTKNLLEEAVCRQLASDVPIGVFLSGGLDSSAITAFASRNYSQPITTFSAGFDFESSSNELPKAALVAKKFKTNHHELMISGYDIADVVEKMVHHHDSPFSDAANIPLFLLGQEVSKSAKVILQGDGGDEIFAGYRRYSTLHNQVFWRPIINSLSKVHSKFASKSKQFYLRQRYLNALNNGDDAELMALLLTVEDKFYSPLNIFSDILRKRMTKVDPFFYYRECNNRFSSHSLVQKMLLTDSQIILPSIFLEKVDRATMAASIEVRVPFLDNHLTEYVMSLPSEMKVRSGQKKWLLKQAMKNILPHEIIFAKKAGFGVPYQFWLKGPLNELFQDKIALVKAQNRNLFNWKYIDQLMSEHLSGSRDHGFILWKLMNLTIWLSTKDLSFE